MQVPIRSRIGNGVLAVLGAIYFLSAIATFIYYVASSWGALGLIDYALQMALIASAIAGLLFLVIALQNRDLRPPRGEKSRSSRDNQTAAASGP